MVNHPYPTKKGEHLPPAKMKSTSSIWASRAARVETMTVQITILHEPTQRHHRVAP